MEPQTGAALAGAIFVLANVLLFWIREWYKNKTWRKNGNHLREIKAEVKNTNDKIDCVDKKVGQTNIKMAEVKTVVDAQGKQCRNTVNRFDRVISEHNKTIISLARNTGRK